MLDLVRVLIAILQSFTTNTATYNFCRGVLEQLARYMIRYQESDLHLGLYSSLTSANNLNLLALLTLFYFSTLLFLLVQV